ncbi:MAG: molybdenum cofactor biosynthesis protein MoeB [Euryarchaeota archaeon]|nr:molybdenum cofactor biosynthesis protein MoeB [Euryarchaeota archaeon]|tara:strand:+ start:32306 stop:33463 length:1158 start_codon:yes stop_codon:yes gene_type:complete
MSIDLTADEKVRYARHLILPQVGESGQKMIKSSSVLVVGAGGLGSPVLMYLAAAGVGRIGIIDDDKVDMTNLQRQIIHSTSSVGELKTESAKKRIHQINPEIVVELFDSRLTIENAEEIISKFDIIVDGTDNFATRYTISDCCEILGKPWVFGSIHRFEGQVSVFNLNGSPNYRDLFPKAPPPELAPNCAEAGVLGVLPGIVGSFQANEVLKIILKMDGILDYELLLIDTQTMNIRKLRYSMNKDREKVTELSEEAISCALSLDEEESLDASHNSENMKEISPLEYVEKLKNGWKPFFLDVRRESEEKIVSLPNTSLRIDHTDIPSRIDEIPKDREIVIYCRSGARSAMVANFLKLSGNYPMDVYNLSGGIHLWSSTIDSSVPRY